ncbi:MAG: glycosyl hydrolase [Bacteroidota bacterium]
MRSRQISTIILFVVLATTLGTSCSSQTETLSGNSDETWPEITTTMKPWLRWWWMGSAVDKENISRRMEEFAEAGIGGVEIFPIYGVKGYEEQYLKHLSPEWIEMVLHTVNEADRLGMEVDMIMGTGWPYGGPQVEPEYAAGKMHIQTYKVKAGTRLDQKIVGNVPDEAELARLQYLMPGESPDMPDPAKLLHLFAFNKDGEKVELTSRVREGNLDWTPDEEYDLYAIFLGKTGQMVKRSSLGGAGFVLDHFSDEAVLDFLEPYENSMDPLHNRLRAIFNDSYEIYGADLTPGFFDQFSQRRGYDLTDHIPLLLPGASGEEVMRVTSDYRETLSELVLEAFSGNWNRWVHEHTFITRQQAHGGPANLLDYYAAADIQECESFYGTTFNIPGLRWESSDAKEAEADLIMWKFASSGTHISGKDLTSSETFTWLREHFKTALSQCKPELEQMLLSGVNHMVIHGSSFFPDEAAWPGWKFYASVHFSPYISTWRDAPGMFQYIARCQSMLQSGKSDNEILVYWPFYDVMDDVNSTNLGGQFLQQLSIHTKDHWLAPSRFYKLVTSLIDKGYSVDFVSDRYLEKAEVTGGKISLSGMEYEALVVPECERMPMNTFSLMADLAGSGGKVVLEGWPESVPGYHNYQERTGQLKQIIEEAGKEIVVDQNVTEALAGLGLQGESLKATGLGFIRRDLEGEKVYFMVNHTPGEIDGYVPLNCSSKSIMIMDPLTGKTGLGKTKPGKALSEVYLQLKPGQTLFIRTSDKKITAPEWEYFQEKGDPHEIAGNWELKFVSGGPVTPENANLEELTSWTELSMEAEAFSGTARYKVALDNPDPEVTHWLLDLGDVRESARVWINGEEMGRFWSVPFSGVTSLLKEGENILEIEVTNLPANRIIDMEKKGVEWKIFHNLNIVDLDYEIFSAADWDPVPSGLLGRVTLTPLRRKIP